MKNFTEKPHINYTIITPTKCTLLLLKCAFCWSNNCVIVNMHGRRTIKTHINYLIYVVAVCTETRWIMFLILKSSYSHTTTYVTVYPRLPNNCNKRKNHTRNLTPCMEIEEKHVCRLTIQYSLAEMSSRNKPTKM
jgi:hypothetical protein